MVPRIRAVRRLGGDGVAPAPRAALQRDEERAVQGREDPRRPVDERRVAPGEALVDVGREVAFEARQHAQPADGAVGRVDAGGEAGVRQRADLVVRDGRSRAPRRSLDAHPAEAILGAVGVHRATAHAAAQVGDPADVSRGEIEAREVDLARAATTREERVDGVTDHERGRLAAGVRIAEDRVCVPRTARRPAQTARCRRSSATNRVRLARAWSSSCTWLPRYSKLPCATGSPSTTRTRSPATSTVLSGRSSGA